MLIARLDKHISAIPAIRDVDALLASGQDATLAIGRSARPLAIAAGFVRDPRPTIVVVPGEEGANRMAQTLAAYLGDERIGRFPLRADAPWSQNRTPAPDVIGARARALTHLSAGDPFIVVVGVRALLRALPPADVRFYEPLTLEVGQEHDLMVLPTELVGLGYERADATFGPGSFSIKGDSVEIHPVGFPSPVRIDLFGDEVERIRTVLAATGQSIAEKTRIDIFPTSELGLSPEAVARFRSHVLSGDVTTVTEDEALAALDLFEQGVRFEDRERFLPFLHSTTVNLLAHASKDTLLVLSEPRSLFDDAMRYHDEVNTRAAEQRISTEGLMISPRELDFSVLTRLDLVSILRAGGTVTGEVEVKRPEVAGREERLIARLKDLTRADQAVVFAIPDRAARESLELALSDASIPFVEDLSHAGETTDLLAREDAQPLTSGIITVVDTPIPTGMVLPDARLAIISVGDLAVRSARHAAHRTRDITEITFPFQPGDFVVHATHGIAHFKDIVRQDVAGLARDYFLLEYAQGDKLYVPLEQVDRLTRYVGPDGSDPRLTRLNTADWSRATTKARKAARKLAFDLVDLYSRRATVRGNRFGPDTSWQREMEESFPYEETPDQLAAIADIKADMESDRPMDRLLCGDVGFGKTEVALRAAFKAVQDSKQVMLLCPTTILAQQHYTTFFERFSAFGAKVEVLSRFRTPAQQREALKGFAEGSVDVLIGTHRLLSRDVNPHDLGLVIVDEEQRFGVQHKEQLKNLREHVDVLSLSATPIPRTMQMAMSGVRDMSLILTPPPSRTPVEVHVGEWDEDIVSAAIRLELARNGQVYYVSNRVRTIDDAVNRVVQAAPEVRVAVAHGQMSERELEAVMESFAAGETDVLIATTIIESGIDNPRTNTLIIEDSQRLGLAQLYQLKGRVGRSRVQAYAYFMFPSSESLTQEATERLMAIDEFQDLGSGMKIAMRDLEIRGAGSLLGAEQHGNLSGVGFDFFTSMLGEAVAEARGEGEIVRADVNIALPARYYLDESYIPRADDRVRAYRRIASAVDLFQVDDIESELIRIFGEMDDAGKALLDRTRLRIRTERLGITAVNYTGGKIVVRDVDIPRDKQKDFKECGTLYYPQSRKLQMKYEGEQEGVVAAALALIERVGGDDEDVG